MLMDYVRNGFPVAAFEKKEDPNGNIICKFSANPVIDITE
jgi:hypothetical protein